MSEESEQDQNFIDGWPMNTPLDIRMGLTKEEGINHPLRWGIILSLIHISEPTRPL